MDEVVIDGENGRALTLRRVLARDAEQIWQYEATLVWPEGTASTKVHDHGVGLSRFMREVAEQWRGFDGTKEFASLEGQLQLACVHDGLGTVQCRVTVRQPWPPVWTVDAVLNFGAGAHLERLATDVEAFVASA